MKHLCGGSSAGQSAARIEFKRGEYIMLRKRFGERLCRLAQVRDFVAEIVETLFYVSVVALSLGTWTRGAEKLAVHRSLLRWMAAGMPERGDERFIRLFGKCD